MGFTAFHSKPSCFMIRFLSINGCIAVLFIYMCECVGEREKRELEIQNKAYYFHIRLF